MTCSASATPATCSISQTSSLPERSEVKRIESLVHHVGPQSFAGSAATARSSDRDGTASLLLPRAPTLIDATWTSEAPPVPAVNASFAPSGDQAPSTASTSSGVRRCGVPPPAGMIQIDEPWAAPGGPSWPGGAFASACGVGAVGWFRPRE